MDEYRPRLSRNSLNVLMLVTVSLIALFNLPNIQSNRAELPSAPNLSANTWLTDSGAQVWFSPILSDDLRVELWFRAGWQFAQNGEAQLLADMLITESLSRNLSVKIALDPDFIKVSLALSSQAGRLQAQLAALSEWLYFPELSQQNLLRLQADAAIQKDSFTTLERLFQYQIADNNSVTRAQLQSFQKSFLHPERAHVSIVGDVSIKTAQVVSEKLLPQTRRIASTTKPKAVNVNDVVTGQRYRLVAWPVLKDVEQDLDMMFGAEILMAAQGQNVKWRPGLSTSIFMITGRPENLQIGWDSDIMLSAKKRLAARWVRQTQSAESLAQLLVFLNAYDLPQNYLQHQYDRLQRIDSKSWKRIVESLFTPLVESTG